MKNAGEKMGWPRTLGRASRIVTPLVPAITVLVLGTFAVRHWTQADDMGPSRMLTNGTWQLTEHLPVSFGGWVGEVWHPPGSARPPLRDVRHHGRVYENVEMGRRVAVLMAQGTDRRDLLGYAVPQWYSDRGWQVLGEEAVVWRIGEVTVPAIEYELSAPGRHGPAGASLGEAGDQMTVTSFAFDPAGRLSSTLVTGLTGSSRSSRTGNAAPLSGATLLVHVAFPGDMPHQERQSAINSLMGTLILSIEQERGAGDMP